MNRRQLERVKQLFIEAEEWGEVSKIQYQLECLSKEESESEHDVEDWMFIAIFWHFSRALNNALKIFYSKMGGEHANHNESNGH